MSMSENSPAFRFAVLTLFPEAFAALTEWGVTGRAFHPVSINPTNVERKAATNGVAGRSGKLEAINQ